MRAMSATKATLRPWIRLCLASCVSLPFVTLACEKPTQHQQLTDTEGRVFEATCQENRCTLNQRSGPITKTAGTIPRLMTPSRLLAICDVKPDADATTTPPDTCRPLVCESDKNCPMLTAGVVGSTCIGGLCVEPVGEIRTPDAIMLCLAGTGLGRSTGQQAERYSLGLNCGSPCKVPTACRQP